MSKRPWFAAVLFACTETILLTFFYWEFLIGQKQFFIRDLGNFFEPLCRFLGDSVRNGQSPLWNSYSYCGMSQVAIPSPGLFYFPNLLFTILPFSEALAYQLILSQLTCGVGAFLLVSSMGWGSAAATICALALSLSGYMFSLQGNFTMPATASWLPLLLWAIRIAKNTEGNHAHSAKSALISFVIFMLITAGRPEIWLLSGLIAVAYVFYVCWKETSVELRKKQLFFYIRAMLIGTLVSMPAILPELEWIPFSRRSTGLQSNEILMFSASWYDFLCIAASLPLGDLQLRMSPFQYLVDANPLGRFIGSSFLSSFVIALAMLGLERNKEQERSLLLNLTLIFTCLIAIACAGSNFPFVDQLVNFLPGVSLFRFPTKLLFLLTLPIALLAARGIRNYLNRTVSFAKYLIFWAFLSSLSALLFYSHRLFLPFFRSEANLVIALKAQEMIASSTLLWTTLALLLIIFFWLGQRTNRKSLATIIACTASGAALLSSAAAYYRLGAPRDYYSSETKLSAKMLQDKGKDAFIRYAPFYLQGFTIPPLYSSSKPLESTLLAGTYSRNMLNGFSNTDFKLHSTHGYEGAMPGDYFWFWMGVYGKSSQYMNVKASNESQSDVPAARLSQICSCDYILTQNWRISPVSHQAEEVPKLSADYFELTEEEHSSNLRIYKVKNSLPHAYLSYSFETLKDNEQVQEKIFNAESTNFDPNRTTLIAAEEQVSPLIAQGQNSELAIEPLKVVNPDSTELFVTADSKQNAILVLTDQYYPGWKATVDDKEVEICRCNGFMRGVFLTPGKHLVKFSYSPSSLLNGYLLALSAVLWQAILFFPRRQKDSSKMQNS